MLTTLLIHLGVAVAVTVGLLLAAQALARNGEAYWALPPALGVGYSAGHALVRGWEWPPPRPAEAVEWLAYLALLTGAVGVVVAAFEIPGRSLASHLGRLCMAGVSVAALTTPVFTALYGRWGVFWQVVVLAGWLACWGNVAALADVLGSGVAVVLTIVGAGAALVLGYSGSLVLSLLATVLVVTLSAAWVVGRLHGSLVWGRGAVGVPVVVIAGLLTVGLVYGDVPVASGLMLVAATAAGWVGRFLPPSLREDGWQWAAVLAGSLAAAALAVLLAARAAPAGGF